MSAPFITVNRMAAQTKKPKSLGIVSLASINGKETLLYSKYSNVNLRGQRKGKAADDPKTRPQTNP
jgi:hypothetical protein